MIPRIDRTIAYVPMAVGSDPPQQTLSLQEQDDEWELYESWEDKGYINYKSGTEVIPPYWRPTNTQLFL